MAIKADTTFSLKDRLFNSQTVGELAAGIAGAWSGFDRAGFEHATLTAFPDLELKERIACMVDGLGEFLPDDFEAARKILLDALPPRLDPSRSDDDFGKYIWIVPGDYIARHGVTKPYLLRSLRFLRESTKRFTAENAIRPFLDVYPDETLDFLNECAVDSNYHVRRLVSEGTRPLLPWAPQVSLPQDRVLALLDMLHADTTRYVTRSVSNHVNDISKHDPDATLATLQRWSKAGRQTPDELAWMTRHSLRTLLDRDHPEALTALGFPTRPAVTLRKLSLTRFVALGESLDVQFTLNSAARQNLAVVMKVHFLKANGTQTPKVFRIKQWFAEKGEARTFSKRQPFRPITTRVLYPGEHRIEIVVNGKTLADEPFVFAA
ncbi:MAG: DNA alkylation repair protein [Gammaproteobacteria bacterium]|nr:DNA alkylation repair protein [Gammaproteobacteria bacterium]